MSLTNRRSTPSSPTKRLALAEKSNNVPSLPSSPTKAKDALQTIDLPLKTSNENPGDSAVFVSRKRPLEDATSRDTSHDLETRPLKQSRTLDDDLLPRVPSQNAASSMQCIAVTPLDIRTGVDAGVDTDRDEGDSSPTEEDETPESSIEARMCSDESGVGIVSAVTTMTEDLSPIEEKASRVNHNPTANAATLPSTQSSCIPSTDQGEGAGPSAAQLLRLRLRLARFKVSTNQASTPLSDLELKASDLVSSAETTNPPKQYLELKIQEGPFMPKRRRSRRRQHHGYRRHDPRRHQDSITETNSRVVSEPAHRLTGNPPVAEVEDVQILGRASSSTSNTNARPRSPQEQPRTLLDIYGEDFERHLWPENARSGKARNPHATGTENHEAESHIHPDSHIEAQASQDLDMQQASNTTVTISARIEKPIIIREDSSNISASSNTAYARDNEATRYGDEIGSLKEDSDSDDAMESNVHPSPKSGCDCESESDSSSDGESEEVAPRLENTRAYKSNPRPHTAITKATVSRVANPSRAAAASHSFNAVLNTPYKTNRSHDDLDPVNAGRRRWRSESPPSSSSHRRRFWDYAGGARARVSDVRGQMRAGAGDGRENEMEKERELTSSAVRGQAAGTLLMLGR